MAQQMSKQEHLQVASTIAQQMGGTGRLKAMVGAHNLVFLSDTRDGGLAFDFKGSRKANKIRVELDRGADLYNVKLYKYNHRTGEIKTVYEGEGIYFDMLIDIFEMHTGLYLTL